MANKIKLTRGTKANIEANKSSLEPYQIVYATDTSEIGVKKANGNVDYFPDTARLENTASKLYGASNLAMPDLEGKEYLGGGNYRIYNQNGITIDYNIYNGVFTINGTWTNETGSAAIIPLLNVNGLTLTVSVQIVSGVLPAGIYYRPSGLTAYSIDTFEGIIYEVPYNRDVDYIRMVNDTVFDNFQYKVQLEKGDTATPYIIPAPFLLPNDIPEWAKTEPPSALRYMQMNANNTVTWRTAAQLRGDIGAATPANITTAVSTHNESPTAHADIRNALNSKQDKLVAGDNITINPTTNVISASGGSFYTKSTDIVLNDTYYGSHSLQSDTVFVELIAHRNGFVQGTMTFSKASLNKGWMGNFLYPWTGQVNGILNITYAGPSTFDIDWDDDDLGSAAANYLTIIEHRFGDA